MHLNPRVQETTNALLGGYKNIFLVPPLDYAVFVPLMKKSHVILTDSGGLQEEAVSLHKPVLVLREVTERPEVLEAGATRLVGTDVQQIVRATTLLMENNEEYQKMAGVANPYGDGHASQRIVTRLIKELFSPPFFKEGAGGS